MSFWPRYSYPSPRATTVTFFPASAPFAKAQGWVTSGTSASASSSSSSIVEIDDSNSDEDTDDIDDMIDDVMNVGDVPFLDDPSYGTYSIKNENKHAKKDVDGVQKLEEKGCDSVD